MKKKNSRARAAWVLVLAAGLSAGCGSAAQEAATPKEKKTVIVGYFPNITHAQPLVGRAQGEYERALGADAAIDWKVFNAGPAAIEALFAGKLDLAYVGPNPAVNAYVRSDGAAARILSGAATGGAALVVRKAAGIAAPQDLKGRKVAVPQIGNTQDVSLRAWLSSQGLKTTETGGDVHVLPISGADQVTLFTKGEIDAAWAVEPWVSILTGQAGGEVFVDESEVWPGGVYSTTVLLVRKDFLDQNPALTARFVQGHRRVTDWIQTHPDEARSLVGAQIALITRKELPAEVLESAWKRVRFSTELPKESILKQADAAFEAGYFKKKPDLTHLFHEVSETDRS